MNNYKSVKGLGAYYIVGISLVYNLLLIALILIIDSYEASMLLKITLIVFNIYQIYYVIICTTLTYYIYDDKICITSAFRLKRVEIPFESIEAYKKARGNIRGVKLSGYGKNHFAIGRALIDKIGSSYMFVTSTKNIIYLKTEDINYGISPEYIDEFEKKLSENNIAEGDWEHKAYKSINLYKDKKFFVPFIIVAIIAIIITINPLILYLMDKLPPMMPLSFDSNFVAVKFGTGKQFAFKQATYGILNMAICFCMYYAAYFCAKYDKKSPYKFVYIPLALSVLFLVVQLRILITFR